MNLRSVSSFALAAAVGAWTLPLHAQTAPGLLRVAATPDGTVLSIDSATIARFGDATYEITAVYQYSQALARQYGFDRMLESQKVDCAGSRRLGVGKHAFRGDTEKLVADNDPAPGEWMAVGEAELPLLQAICSALQQSFATSLPVDYEVAEVETQPSLANRVDVQRSVVAEYPRLLRDAGVSGTAMLRMRVKPDGRVDRGSVRVESSTHDAFSEAAKRVAEVMWFTPAQVNGQPVAVWVSLPVVFQVVGNGRTTVFAGNPIPAPPAPEGNVSAGTPHRPGQGTSTCTLPPPACGATP